jgi:hypothetical protein
MTVRFTLLLLAFSLARAAAACEIQTAQVGFSGTPFAANPFQVADQTVYFFRGSSNEAAFTYELRQDKWCYVLQSSPNERVPKTGCLESAHSRRAGALTSLTLKSGNGNPVANINAEKRRLAAVILDSRGKDTGKRIIFRAQSDALEVKGWNCPNARYLSCVGAELKTYAENPGDEARPRPSVKRVELSKRLGHYSATCSGVHELNE